MDGVEPLRLGERQVDALLRDDAQARASNLWLIERVSCGGWRRA